MKAPHTPQDEVIADDKPLAGVELYLDVTLNQNAIGLARFGLDKNKLYASANSLRRIGIRIPAQTPDPVCLNDIPQLEMHYNAQLQSLALMAPLSALDMGTTQLNQQNVISPAASTSRGLVLNYDLYASQERRCAEQRQRLQRTAGI